MRKKIPEDKKRKSLTLTIDEDLLNLFDEYSNDKNIKNKSRYIESLIRKDMESRGEDIKREF
jgi:metal-responsive CopG/Arc/MetJ family transcriptional regulator